MKGLSVFTLLLLSVYTSAQITPVITGVISTTSLTNGGLLNYDIIVNSTSPANFLYYTFTIGDFQSGGGGVFGYQAINGTTNQWIISFPFNVPKFFSGVADLSDLKVLNEYGSFSTQNLTHFIVPIVSNQTAVPGPPQILNFSRQGNPSTIALAGIPITYLLTFQSTSPPYYLSVVFTAVNGIKSMGYMGFQSDVFSCNTPNSTCDDGQLHSWNATISFSFTESDRSGLYALTSLQLMNECMMSAVANASSSLARNISAISFSTPPGSLVVTSIGVAVQPVLIRNGGWVNLTMYVSAQTSQPLNMLYFMVSSPNGRIVSGGGGSTQFTQTSPGRWTCTTPLIRISPWAASGTWNITNIQVGSGARIASYSARTSFQVNNALQPMSPQLSVSVASGSTNKRSSSPMLTIIYTVRCDSPIIWLSTKINGPQVNVNYSESTSFVSISGKVFTHVMHVDLPENATGTYTISDSYVDSEALEFSNIYPDVSVEFSNGEIVQSVSSNSPIKVPLTIMLAILLLLHCK